MKRVLIAITIALTSNSILAAGSFDGPYVQLGIGGSETSTKISGTNGALDGSASQGNANGLLAAGWSQAIGSEGFNLGANLLYVIGNQNAGQKSGDWTTTGNSYTAHGNTNGQGKLKNTFGISVEPGWNFTESTLGYVKLAWLNTRFDGGLNGTWTCTGCTSNSGSNSINGSKASNGFGYGLGVKQLLTRDIFVGIDLMGVTYSAPDYGDGTSVKPSQFLGFASIGYKF